MQLQIDIARGVRQIPPDDAAALVAGAFSSDAARCSMKVLRPMATSS